MTLLSNNFFLTLMTLIKSFTSAILEVYWQFLTQFTMLFVCRSSFQRLRRMQALQKKISNSTENGITCTIFSILSWNFCWIVKIYTHEENVNNCFKTSIFVTFYGEHNYHRNVLSGMANSIFCLLLTFLIAFWRAWPLFHCCPAWAAVKLKYLIGGG